MNPTATQLLQVKQRIQIACTAAQRDPQSVQLIAVSKTHSAASVRTAFLAGQAAFGENYAQEGVDKIAALQDLREQLTWHFIGPIQSNKTRLIAQSFDWVQSVDRIRIAQRLSEQRPPEMPNLNICLQVNISGEASKSGVLPAQALSTCIDIVELDNLSLRGLMAIPEPGADPQTLQEFSLLFTEVQQHLKKHQFTHQFDTLSIGMSDDLEQSILAGSTMVRIGTAIFGARQTLENSNNADD